MEYLIMQIQWTPEISLAVMLSAITLVLNLVVYFKTRKEVRHNQSITLIAVIRQFNSDLRKWADEVIDQMTIAVFLCDLNPSKDDGTFYMKRHELRTKLSALSDRGKFFLPNVGKDKYGQSKAGAYRGFRSEVLDHILECQNLVGKLNYKDQQPNLSLRQEIVNAKRKFVSALSDELDPEQFEREVKAIILQLHKVYKKR